MKSPEITRHVRDIAELEAENARLRARVAELEAALELAEGCLDRGNPDIDYVIGKIETALERKAGGKPTMEQEKNECK